MREKRRMGSRLQAEAAIGTAATLQRGGRNVLSAEGRIRKAVSAINSEIKFNNKFEFLYNAI